MVVTSFNGREDTLACLRSLKATRQSPHRVILVDDASTDGTAESVHREFPDVFVVRNERNLGYVPSLNRGIRLAMDADWILLLNNDVLLSDGLIAGLIGVADSDAQIGLCGPQMYFASHPTVLWAAGGRVSPWTWRTRHEHQGHTRDGGPDPRDVDYIPAAAMLVRKQVFREIGLFEPSFEAYFEEVDFCLRLRQAGYRVTYVPTVRIWHKVSVTMKRVYGTGRMKFFGVRNRRWCMRRHAPALRRPLLQAIDALVTAAQVAYNFVVTSPATAMHVLRGYCAGWRAMPPSRPVTKSWGRPDADALVPAPVVGGEARHATKTSVE